MSVIEISLKSKECLLDPSLSSSPKMGLGMSPGGSKCDSMVASLLLVGLPLPSFFPSIETVDYRRFRRSLTAIVVVASSISPESSRECRMMSQSPQQPTSIHLRAPLYRRRRRRWVASKCILLLRRGTTQCGQCIRSLFKFVTTFTGWLEILFDANR